VILIAYESRDKPDLEDLPGHRALGLQTETDFLSAVAEERTKWRDVSNG
jgi:hypothetical protein